MASAMMCGIKSAHKTTGRIFSLAILGLKNQSDLLFT